MKKFKHLYRRRNLAGRTVYRFLPSNKKMRDAKTTVSHRKDVAWLIHQFERDKDWYLDRSKRTPEEIDYAFKIFGNTDGPVPAIAIQRKDCRDLYNELRDDGSDQFGQQRSDHDRDRHIQWPQAKFTCLGDICEARAGSGKKGAR